MKPEYAEVVKELEKRLYDYFDSFEIPDTPTVYDFLILSLTRRMSLQHLIGIHFAQVYVRCYEITDNLPHLKEPRCLGKCGKGIL